MIRHTDQQDADYIEFNFKNQFPAIFPNNQGDISPIKLRKD